MRCSFRSRATQQLSPHLNFIKLAIRGNHGLALPDWSSRKEGYNISTTLLPVYHMRRYAAYYAPKHGLQGLPSLPHGIEKEWWALCPQDTLFPFPVVAKQSCTQEDRGTQGLGRDVMGYWWWSREVFLCGMEGLRGQCCSRYAAFWDLSTVISQRMGP